MRLLPLKFACCAWSLAFGLFITVGCTGEPQPATPPSSTTTSTDKPDASGPDTSTPVASHSDPATDKPATDKADTDNPANDPDSGKPGPEGTTNSGNNDGTKGPLGNDLAGLKPDVPDGDDQTVPPPLEREKPKPLPTPPEAQGLKRLSEEHDIWLDPAKKQVVLAGEIVLRDGPLEMLACLKETKEHESLVAINTKAAFVHAALQALGANPGHPVEFRPEYKKAEGPEVAVTVCWTDDQGKRQCGPAQHWIRNAKTNKELAVPWVFGGSGFFQSVDGQNYYMAEDGDLICISNFTSAMLDLPIESSQSDDALLFEAWTDRIPERGTKVALILKPDLSKKGEKQEGDKPAEDSKPEDAKPGDVKSEDPKSDAKPDDAKSDEAKPDEASAKP